MILKDNMSSPKGHVFISLLFVLNRLVVQYFGNFHNFDDFHDTLF